MYTTLLTVLAAGTSLLSLSTAAPAGAPYNPTSPDPTSVIVTLFGATPEAVYSVSVPTNGDFTFTYNALSISHAQTDGGPCGLFGIDNLLQEIPTASYVDVGPPQTIIGIACGPKKGVNGW